MALWQRGFYHPEINYALRQTLVLSIPIVVMLLFNHLAIGIMMSLVPACCNISGLDTPHKRFFKRLIIGGILFSSSSVLLQILLLNEHLPLAIIMLSLALILGITGEISPLHGRLLPGTLVAVIFTLSMVGQVPLWYPPLLYLCGTAWYGAFTWLWFRLSKEQPMRETLCLLYRQLADYFEAKYSLLTQLTDPDIALPPLFKRQQQVIDIIAQLYQQLHMLPGDDHHRLLRSFQVALDLQEHITVSLQMPADVQKLVEASHAEAVIRRNAQVIAARLREIGEDILYHRQSERFNMENELAALEKIASRHPDNPVGSFCAYHFSRIARLLRTQRPLYRRDLMQSQGRLPFWPALRNYLSLKSAALRNAMRLGVVLAIGSHVGLFFNLPKAYWILLTIMLVSQNGYNATRIRIQHRALGTIAGLLVAAVLLHLHLPEGITLCCMLVINLASFMVLRKNYGLAVIGLTVIAVYTLQLLSLDGADILLPRLEDTLIGCALTFAGNIWLWPQWQSGQLRDNAYQALECDQQAIRLLLQENSTADQLAYARMRANQAHNTLFSALNQAMQEPGFNSGYLADMHLWVTHSQFIVEHINAMTILAREHYMLPPTLAMDYLQTAEIAIQSCQQRLTYDGPANNTPLFSAPELHPDMPVTEMERHLRRMISHLSFMLTISSLAWKQRPHHGIWLTRVIHH
jgi:YccS/YhfK family integral membrane protein